MVVTWWCFLLLVVATWLAYRNSFFTPLVFDDLKHIRDNPAIRSLWPLGPIFSNTSRPFLVLSLALNYSFGGLNVFGYHVANFAIHVTAGIALFALVFRTLRLDPETGQSISRARWLALSISLIWLIHPLQTESVTYIIQRGESMMGMFFILFIYCYLRGSQAARAWPWYVTAVAIFWLGVGTKEVMVMALPVALLYDRVFLSKTPAEIFRQRWPMYAACGIAVVWFALFLLPVHSHSDNPAAGFGMREVTPLGYLATQQGVVLHYLRLALWPDRLCFDYLWPWATSPREIVLPGAVMSALLLISVLALVYRPRIGFLAISFFLILAPTSSIVPIADAAAERRMYLPLALLSILLVMGMHRAAHRLLMSDQAKRVAQIAVIVFVALALVLCTSRRNRDYRSVERVWSDVIEKAPHNWSAHFNLGAHYASFNPPRLEDAKANYDQVIRLRPQHAPVYNNYGNLYARQGDYESAADWYRKALSQQQDYLSAQFHLGLSLDYNGQTEEAVAALQQALQLDPGHRDAARRLAWILSTDNDPAVRDGNEAIRLAENLGAESDYRIAQVLAAAYAEAGHFDRATEVARRAHQAARAAPDQTRAGELENQLSFYESNTPFRRKASD